MKYDKACVLLGVVAIAAVANRTFSTEPESKSTAAKEIKTEQVHIVNDLGRTVLVLSALGEGWPGVGINHPDEARSLGSLMMTERRLVTLKLDTYSGAAASLALFPDGSSAFEITGGEKKQGKIAFGVGSDGVPVIKMIDGAGKTVWSQGGSGQP